MPSGKTHDIITAASTPIVGFVTHAITDDIKSSLIVTAFYLFASLMFNGDLDIKSKPYNRWWILKWLWLPYQRWFSHRSIWTHGILLGTIVRILYLMPLIVIIITLLNFKISIDQDILVLVFIGLELGNTVHTVSDYIYS